MGLSSSITSDCGTPISSIGIVREWWYMGWRFKPHLGLGRHATHLPSREMETWYLDIIKDGIILIYLDCKYNDINSVLVHMEWDGTG